MNMLRTLLIPLIMCMIHAYSAPSEQVYYKGRVLSLQEYRFINRPASHLQFLMKTQKGEQITVEVGPVWYLEVEGLKLDPQMRVEVKGMMEQVDGKELLIAYRIFIGNEHWLLRHPDGTPAWAKGMLKNSRNAFKKGN